MKRKEKMQKLLWRVMLLVVLVLGGVGPLLAAPAGEKSPDFFLKRGAECLDKGEHDQAIADFTQALKLKPDSAEAYHQRGLAYGDKGQYDQAIADITKALKLNPKNAEAYFDRAMAYAETGKYDNAWQDVDQAQQLGFQVHPEFLEKLRQASGRKK